MIITFDLKAKSSRRTKNISVLTYLKNNDVVDKYVRIMNSVSPLSLQFQNDFNNLYCLNMSLGMNKTNFYIIFDEYYNHKNNKYVCYRNILNDLKSPYGTRRNEASFGSKLLHTIDCNEPIIDDQVVTKLRKCPYTAKYFFGISKTINSIEKAICLHNALKICYYDCLIPCAKNAGFFDAFDVAFSLAKHISEVKKIDFYLWAM